MPAFSNCNVFLPVVVLDLLEGPARISGGQGADGTFDQAINSLLFFTQVSILPAKPQHHLLGYSHPYKTNPRPLPPPLLPAQASGTRNSGNTSRRTLLARPIGSSVYLLCICGTSSLPRSAAAAAACGMTYSPASSAPPLFSHKSRTHPLEPPLPSSTLRAPRQALQRPPPFLDPPQHFPILLLPPLKDPEPAQQRAERVNLRYRLLRLQLKERQRPQEDDEGERGEAREVVEEDPVA